MGIVEAPERARGDETPGPRDSADAARERIVVRAVVETRGVGCVRVTDAGAHRVQ
jgi:hypothetical protein